MRQVCKLILLLLTAVPFVCGGCNPTARVDPEALKTQAIRRLRQSVNSDNVLVRSGAIETCVELRLANAPDICTKAISCSVPMLQFAGGMGLIEMPSPAAEPALTKLLSSTDSSVRLAAIGALHKLGNTQHSAELITALEGPDPKVRGNALTVLGRLGDESVMPSLRNVLENDDVERVRLQAAEALVLLGDETVLPRLQLWQYSTNWQERIFAVQLMGQVSQKDLFVPDLLQALADQNQMVQLQAARSLGQLGYKDGFGTAMHYLYPSDPDEATIAAQMGLDRNDPELPQRITQIRSLAALALGQIGVWDGARALQRALADDDPQVALAAARASLRLLQKTNKAQIQPSDLTKP